MAQSFLSSTIEHPLALGSFRSWLRLLEESEGIDPEFWPRALAVSLTTCLTSPLRLAEHLRYDRAIRQTAIAPSPIIIIGHWRSGTTHLHNLLSQDPQWGYVPLFQTIAAGFGLVSAKTIKPLLARIARRLHPTRIIDNIPLAFDAAQEEEYAIANMSPYSFLHLFVLPRQAPFFFERYVLFDDLPAQTLAEWKEIYLTILRKASLHTNGKRLVLKNPAHTGRLRTVLEMFPDAKFIYLYRNPYRVFSSMRWLYKKVLATAQLQKISPAQADAYILQCYVRLIRRYLADKSCIPAGNLIEVKFEEVEATPLEQVRRLYEGLNLPGFAEAEPAFRQYIASIADYQKNAYQVGDEIIEQVNRHWGFALEAYGYPRLEPSQSLEAATT